MFVDFILIQLSEINLIKEKNNKKLVRPYAEDTVSRKHHVFTLQTPCSCPVNTMFLSCKHYVSHYSFD